MTTLLGIAITLMPFASVLVLLRMMAHREALRAARYARQIALTNAIHRDFGAVAAPTVERRRGEWWVHMRVPVEQPALVAALVALTDRVFARYDARDPGQVRIVLTPAASDSLGRASRVNSMAPPIASPATPALAGIR